MKTNEKKVRKTITLSKEVANQLEKLAKEENKSQSALIEEMIKERTNLKAKREAIERIKKRRKYFKGINPNLTVQKIKEMQGEEL
jgi:predicted CopG family antitoxin